MTELELAKERLQQGGYTCVLCKGDIVIVSKSRGVKPLVTWLQSGEEYAEYVAADKVVGRATAFLYTLLGVKGVYAEVLSVRALEVLLQAGIAVKYGKLVEHIINRQGTGICPFEEAVLEVTEKEEAYAVIQRTMKSLQIQ